MPNIRQLTLVGGGRPTRFGYPNDVFGTSMARAGEPVTTIQAWLGHCDLKTTQRYMHLSPHGTDAMIGVLERGAGVEQVSNKV